MRCIFNIRTVVVAAAAVGLAVFLVLQLQNYVNIYSITISKQNLTSSIISGAMSGIMELFSTANQLAPGPTINKIKHQWWKPVEAKIKVAQECFYIKNMIN